MFSSTQAKLKCCNLNAYAIAICGTYHLDALTRTRSITALQLRLVELNIYFLWWTAWSWLYLSHSARSGADTLGYARLLWWQQSTFFVSENSFCVHQNCFQAQLTDYSRLVIHTTQDFTKLSVPTISITTREKASHNSSFKTETLRTLKLKGWEGCEICSQLANLFGWFRIVRAAHFGRVDQYRWRSPGEGRKDFYHDALWTKNVVDVGKFFSLFLCAMTSWIRIWSRIFNWSPISPKKRIRCLTFDHEYLGYGLVEDGTGNRLDSPESGLSNDMLHAWGHHEPRWQNWATGSFDTRKSGAEVTRSNCRVVLNV